MTQMTRDHRIDYASPVTLLLPKDPHAVTGHTANISESGIFVTVSRPCTVGDEVVCDLPRVGEHLRLRGEVIWVQEVPCSDREPLTGMGVRFVSLSADDLTALKRFVSTHRGQPQSVVVHFQGYAKPIRASALVTDRGLQLWTALPFLRLRSPVNVSFSGDDAGATVAKRAQHGVLNQVELDLEQGVPRLQIQVGLDSLPEVQAEPEDSPWEPGQVIFTAPGYASEVEGSEDEDEDDGVLIVDAAAEAASEHTSRSAGDNEGVVAGVIEQCSSDNGGSDEDASSERPQQSACWSPTTVETAPQLESLAEADPSAEPHWSLGQPHPGEDAPYNRFWGEAERRRHRIWLWVAALLMAGIALASMVQTEFWNQVSDRLWAGAAANNAESTAAALPGSLPDLAPLPVATATNTTPRVAAKMPRVVEQQKTPAPESKPKAVPKIKARATDEPAPSNVSDRFVVESQPDGIKLTIPFEGSATEAGHYLLAEPDGVAVNLPNGRPKLGLGHYALNRDGFRAIWVRKRLGGSQVRIFFSGPPASRPKVEVAEGQIRISVPR